MILSGSSHNAYRNRTIHWRCSGEGHQREMAGLCGLTTANLLCTVSAGRGLCVPVPVNPVAAECGGEGAGPIVIRQSAQSNSPTTYLGTDKGRVASAVRDLLRHRAEVTTRFQLGSRDRPDGFSATVGNIVRCLAAVIALWVAILGAESELLGSEGAPVAHGPHALNAYSAEASSLVAVEHSHISRGTAPLSADTFAEAVLPRGAVSLLAVALMAVLVGVALLWRHRVLSTPRGPPEGRSHTLSGREVLARLCIARR